MKIASVMGGLIAIVGTTILVGLQRGLQRSLALVEREVLFATSLNLIVLALAALGLFLIIYGVGLTLPDSRLRPRSLLVLVEAPLALFVGGMMAWVLNVFRMAGDMGPRHPVDASESLPFPLYIFVNPLVFYCLLMVVLATIAFGALRLHRSAA